MDFWTNSAISIAIGAIITAVGNFIIGFKKQRVQDQLALNKQAFEVLQAAINAMQKDKEALEKDFSQLNKMNMDCREARAGALMENKFLAQKITSLEAEIARLQKNPR